MVFVLVCDRGLQEGELELLKNDHFNIFFKKKVFGQFKAWIILNFAEIVNFMSLILCRIVFCL